MFLRAAGCIAPGTARNRVGILPAQQPSAAGSVRARGGYLQRRGASCPCSISTILAGGAQGQNRRERFAAVSLQFGALFITRR